MAKRFPQMTFSFKYMNGFHFKVPVQTERINNKKNIITYSLIHGKRRPFSFKCQREVIQLAFMVYDGTEK